MRISRRSVVADSTRLAFTAEDDWRTAIGILRDRFETRSLEDVRALLQRPTSGFANGVPGVGPEGGRGGRPRAWTGQKMRTRTGRRGAA